jgi:uncharacterized protein
VHQPEVAALSPITFEMVRKDAEVHEYVIRSNEMLRAIGYTEHGLRHVGLVAHRAMKVGRELDLPQRQIELAGIAAYLHDMGNIVNRNDHGQTSAVMAFHILSRMGMAPVELTEVMAAIGNHEEQFGNPVSNVAALLILADKSDVHRTRVHNRDLATFGIHDRVNFAATKSDLTADAAEKRIRLSLTVDTNIIAIMEYFEIFLSRMVMCRRAAAHLDCRFELLINETRLL